MTWEEVRDLDRARAVAVLPVGAVEAHGPHLPLATDVIIAEAMARSGAERLAAPPHSLHPVLLPALTYTAAPFAAGFPGTMSLAPDIVAAVLLDIAASLSRHSFRLLAVANAHLDPANLDAIRSAVTKIHAERLLTVVFPDVTSAPWARRLTDEFRSGACHAGRYEGSLVLATQPELVHEVVRQTLPPNPASLSAAIRAGKRSFEDAGGPRAYFGYPADATAAEGRATIGVLGEILAEAVLAAVPAGAER